MYFMMFKTIYYFLNGIIYMLRYAEVSLKRTRDSASIQFLQDDFVQVPDQPLLETLGQLM